MTGRRGTIGLMLVWILLIVIVAAIVILGSWIFSRLSGRGEVLPPMDEPVAVIAENRDALARGDLGAIAFDIVPRGYRQDQVDDIIQALSQQLIANQNRYREQLRKRGPADLTVLLQADSRHQEVLGIAASEANSAAPDANSTAPEADFAAATALPAPGSVWLRAAVEVESLGILGHRGAHQANAS